jgi:hypothetical protein
MNEPLTSAESALEAAQDDVDIQHYFIVDRVHAVGFSQR